MFGEEAAGGFGGGAVGEGEGGVEEEVCGGGVSMKR